MMPEFVRLRNGKLLNLTMVTVIKKLADGWYALMLDSTEVTPHEIHLTDAEYEFIRDNYSKGPIQQEQKS